MRSHQAPKGTSFRITDLRALRGPQLAPGGARAPAHGPVVPAVLKLASLALRVRLHRFPALKTPLSEVTLPAVSNAAAGGCVRIFCKKREGYASPSQTSTLSRLASIHFCAASSSGMPPSISVMTEAMSSAVHSNRVRMP